MSRIVSAQPTIDETDIAAVAVQMRSGHLEDGETVRQFEQEVSRRMAKPHAIATVNGFAALHILLIALDIGPGDEVIVPSYSCPALLHAVRQSGAEPIYADVAIDTFALDVTTVSAVLTPRTKAVIFTYLFGFPADIAPLVEAFPKLTMIEDVAQALGVEHDSVPLGGRAPHAITSFYATKMITSGDGGMVITSDEAVSERCRQLVYYGGQRGKQDQAFNYHTTNLNAALGLSQLERLDSFIAWRQRAARIYDEEIAESNHVARPFRYRSSSGYLRYPLLLPDREKRDSLKSAMGSKGISCGLGVLEALHVKEETGQSLPNTEALTDRLLCLPLYPAMSDGDLHLLAREFSRLVRLL